MFWKYDRNWWILWIIPPPNFNPLTHVCLSVCPLGIRRDLWTACMRRCRAPVIVPHSRSPADLADAPAARRPCWLTAQSGEARENLYPWYVGLVLYHEKLHYPCAHTETHYTTCEWCRHVNTHDQIAWGHFVEELGLKTRLNIKNKADYEMMSRASWQLPLRQGQMFTLGLSCKFSVSLVPEVFWMWHKVPYLILTVKPLMLCFPSGNASDAENQLKQNKKKVSWEGNYPSIVPSCQLNQLYVCSHIMCVTLLRTDKKIVLKTSSNPGKN